MGGGKSKLRRGSPGATDQDLNFLMDNLHLNSSDLNKLMKAFRKFDLGKDGKVQYDEFCSRLRCEPTDLLHALFTFFGGDQESRSNPVLNFAEFSLLVTNFLTLDERGLIEFLFIVLTSRKEDRVPVASVPFRLVEQAMLGLLQMVDSTKLASFLTKLSESDHGKLYITESKFVDAVMSHNKSIAFPFVAYQLDMTGRVVGAGFWNSRRSNTPNGKILSLRYDLQMLLLRESSGDAAKDGVAEDEIEFGEETAC